MAAKGEKNRTGKGKKAATGAEAGPAYKRVKAGCRVKEDCPAKAEAPNPDFWHLRLYVAGQTPKSLAAFQNLQKICEERLKGRYSIEVVDLLENPQLAKGDQILAVPTLVRRLPPPLRKIIGDLSNKERVLVGLDMVGIAYRGK